MGQFFHLGINPYIMYSEILSNTSITMQIVTIQIYLDVSKIMFHPQYLCVSKRVNGFPINELSSCQCLSHCQWLSVYNAHSLITSSRGNVSSHKLTRLCLFGFECKIDQVPNFGLVSALLALYERRFLFSEFEENVKKDYLIFTDVDQNKELLCFDIFYMFFSFDVRWCFIR